MCKYPEIKQASKLVTKPSTQKKKRPTSQNIHTLGHKLRANKHVSLYMLTNTRLVETCSYLSASLIFHLCKKELHINTFNQQTDKSMFITIVQGDPVRPSRIHQHIYSRVQHMGMGRRISATPVTCSVDCYTLTITATTL